MLHFLQSSSIPVGVTGGGEMLIPSSPAAASQSQAIRCINNSPNSYLFISPNQMVRRHWTKMQQRHRQQKWRYISKELFGGGRGVGGAVGLAAPRPHQMKNPSLHWPGSVCLHLPRRICSQREKSLCKNATPPAHRLRPPSRRQ